MLPPPPTSTLFPYTTLFRSIGSPAPHCGWPLQSCDCSPARPGTEHRQIVCQYHLDRKSTRLNSSHVSISYAVFCLKKKNRTYLFIPRIATMPFFVCLRLLKL